MDKGKSHIINSKDYQRYLHGQMTSEERHDFERTLLDNEFEQEAFEGLSQLTTGEIDKDLTALKKQLANKTKKRDSGNYWKIAASLLLLGLFSFITYFLIESSDPAEIVQTKKVTPVAETDETQKNVEDSPNTSEMDSDRIVAYRRDLEKTKKPPQELSHQPGLEEQASGVLLADEVVEEEKEDKVLDLDMEIVESIDLSVLSLAKEEQFDEESKKRGKDIVAENAFAPASVLRKNSVNKRKSMVAGNANMRTITGTIMSAENDEVIPGVNIIVNETGTGVISNIDGHYSIEVPKDEEITLVFSSVGYMSEEIVAGDHSTIDVNIESDITALSEIVVVGYGTASEMKKQDYNFTPPNPVGGLEKFKRYVKENIRYPESGLEDKVRGTVKLKFTVEKNSIISNMEVLKSLGWDFDKEAIRLVMEGPKWEPAMESSSNVAKEVKVKIRFRVPD